MRLIDANVILRCILDDNPEMTAEAIAIIDSGAYTKPEIIAEVVYVPKKSMVYSVRRSETCCWKYPKLFIAQMRKA